MLKNLRTSEISSLIKETLLSVLEDNKAQDIYLIDLKGKTELADYMVVANGTSTRQVAALAKHVAAALDELALTEYTIEGEDDPKWIIVDNPFVIVHLMHPEYRELYQLEKMWEPEDLFAELDESAEGAI